MADERFDLRLRDLGVTMRPATYGDNTWLARIDTDILGASWVTMTYERADPSEGEDEGGMFTATTVCCSFEGEWCYGTNHFDAAWNSLLDVIDRWSPPLALEIRRLEWAYQERVKRAELNGETLEDEEEANL